jgi:hypothetical protein
MTQLDDDQHFTQQFLAQIRGAFPDVPYEGLNTPADGKTGEDYDEHKALYDALHEKPWSKIPASFIQGNIHGLALLTPEAFVAYLPAWLRESLVNAELAEVLVYTFSPEPGKDQEYMDRRTHALSPIQKEVLATFLAYCLRTTTSGFVKGQAEQALEYVRTSHIPSSN